MSLFTLLIEIYPDLYPFVQISSTSDDDTRGWFGGDNFRLIRKKKVVGSAEYRAQNVGLNMTGLVELFNLPC